jgi:hypothetical protein
MNELSETPNDPVTVCRIISSGYRRQVVCFRAKSTPVVRPVRKAMGLSEIARLLPRGHRDGVCCAGWYPGRAKQDVHRGMGQYPSAGY